MGADQENPHDVLAINAASAALMVSGLPFEGPIGRRAGGLFAAGSMDPYPTYAEGDDSTFELVVAGRGLPDGDVAIMMVEAGGTEGAWGFYANGAPKVTEEVIAQGLEAAKTWIKSRIELQLKLKAQAGSGPRWPSSPSGTTAPTSTNRVEAGLRAHRQGHHHLAQVRAGGGHGDVPSRCWTSCRPSSPGASERSVPPCAP